MSLGPAEILVIFVVALLVFGPSRLPEIGRHVGRGMREIKKFQETLKGDLEDVLGDHPSDEPDVNPTAAQQPAPTLPPKELPAPATAGEAAPAAAPETSAATSEAPPTNPRA